MGIYSNQSVKHRHGHFERISHDISDIVPMVESFIHMAENIFEKKGENAGRWFDLRLGQYSFRGLMIVIATGFIPLSPLSVVRQWLCGIAASGWERILCGVLVKRTQGRHG